jgi:hypothetical protein
MVLFTGILDTVVVARGVETLSNGEGEGITLFLI